MRERAPERERVGLFNKHICLPFKKFIVKNIQSTKQTKADQMISSNHTNAYHNVGVTYTSNHFANQLTFLPEAPSWNPFKEKIYI